MKPIEKDELYDHLCGFLKAKGVELKAGSYSQTIQKSCSILADAINLGHRGIEKAKTGIDERIDQMRQVIHEKTAPQAATAQKAPGANPQPAPQAAPHGKAASANPKAKVKKPAAKKRTTHRGKRQG